MSLRPFHERTFLPMDDLCALISERSPYLRTLMARRPITLEALKKAAPETMGATINQSLLGAITEDSHKNLERALRLAKADTHLICAFCDVGQVWTLEDVTRHLTRFADAAMQAALASVAWHLHNQGLMPEPDISAKHGPLPGLFIIAMGKYGAGELNYSSDVDFTIFFDPDIAQSWLGNNPSRLTAKLVRQLVHTMGGVTQDGYVFRTDMRLRPDPGSTNPAVSTTGAYIYYETVGQNWERAALIKARVCAGDLHAGQKFLDELQPFIWRRSLDFAAIEDIHAMKRQIHISLKQSGFEAAGHDVKLGRGGIREIEFFTQTQQLILGGRDRSLRVPQTCSALNALVNAGHIKKDTATELTTHYRTLRRAEHGAQMLADQQTHILPTDSDKRAAIAALCGSDSLIEFDAKMEEVFQQVHTRYFELFPQSETLAVTTGNLVFTGVEDDPATLAALQEKGFTEPHIFLQRMRAWHAGQIRATRSDRARALLTRMGPDLVSALAATDDPDHAFSVFTRFFEKLNTGVQPLSLFCNRPMLLDLVVSVLNTAPRLANSFSNRVSILDAMLDPSFSIPLGEDLQAGANRISQCARNSSDFEGLLNATRRTALEERLRIGVQTLTNQASLEEAALSYSHLASACVDTLASACTTQMKDRYGVPPGDWAILGMGSLGAMQMNEGSDLDLFTIYQKDDTVENSVDPTRYFTRFTQRLIGALSAQTPEGALYEIDMKLRPSGKAGPVAVNWPAFVEYYANEAWTWEHLALGRARVIAASSPAFEKTISTHISHKLQQPYDFILLSSDVRNMLKRLKNEFPDADIWDLKHAPGGLVTIELLQQVLRIKSNAQPLQEQEIDFVLKLKDAQKLMAGLLHILRLCLPSAALSPPFALSVQKLLTKKMNIQDFTALETVLEEKQKQVWQISEQILMQ